jgi:MFS family permease
MAGTPADSGACGFTTAGLGQLTTAAPDHRTTLRLGRFCQTVLVPNWTKPLANEDKPLTWRMPLALLVGAVLGGLGAFWMDPAGLMLAVASGAFMAIIAAMGPMVMALRAVLVVGALIVGAAVLGAATSGNPWLASLFMASLAFMGSLWTTIPLVGPLAGAFPGMIFLLVATKGVAVPGGDDWRQTGLAALIGVASAALVAVLFNANDPTGGSRKAVAGAWGPGANLHVHGSVAQMLRFDGQPRRLSALLGLATLALLSRRLASNEEPGDPAVAAGIAAGVAGDEAVQAALLPKGRLTPRTIEVDSAVMADGGGHDTDHQMLGLGQWSESLTRARNLLSGELRPPKPKKMGVGLTSEMMRMLKSPDASAFRFGVQRALGLGVGMLVLLQTVSESAFWVLLTVFAVLQVNTSATWARSVQRGAGTLVGALGAVGVAWIVPKEVLVPWLSIAVILVGIAYVQRNHAVMTAAVAAAIVWLLGAHQEDTWLWARERIVDTIVGVVIAFALSALVLPYRPQPTRHRNSVIRNLERLQAELETVARDPEDASRSIREIESDIAISFANYETDVAMLPKADRGTEESSILALNNQWDRLNALVLLSRVDTDTIEGRDELLKLGLVRVKAGFVELA